MTPIADDEYDVAMTVRFFPTADGGRRSAVGRGTLDYYSCPIRVGGEAYDCRIYLEGRVLELGTDYAVRAQFLSPKAAAGLLPAGTHFAIWEGRNVGTGHIIEWLR